MRQDKAIRTLARHIIAAWIEDGIRAKCPTTGRPDCTASMARALGICDKAELIDLAPHILGHITKEMSDIAPLTDSLVDAMDVLGIGEEQPA